MSKIKDFRIYLKGEDKTDSVRSYRRVGNIYEVTINTGKTFNYSIQNVKIIGPRESFSYLKRIADEVGIEVEVDGRTINILSINYSKIKTIPADTLLGSFVSGNQLLSKISNLNSDKIVFPFGFNISQQNAVQKAFGSSLSIIQGPPGTGKTQTVLNIIANPVMRGKSVAVVSSNNSATKNVYEKMEKNGLEFIYKTVEGNHARNRTNQRQIDMIREEVIPQQKLNTTDSSLGIITPYRNQTNALQKAFEGLKLKADTVDKFQGQENSIVILSTVDNEVTEFSDNANRLNVAVSRAIEQLIVVVSDEDVRSETNVGDLVRYIQYNNFAIIESKIRSVFDYLYASYAERRRKLLYKHKNMSRYDSENLMHAKIETIFKENDLTNLKIATHVPLRMILQDTSLLTSDELKYAGNVNTHVDFLVYDKISKTPKLIVEVDGVSFHEEGSKQSDRDLMKNEILRKYSLPFLRFKTDGSGEEKLLLQALKPTF